MCCCGRSPSFESSLGGEWTESQIKTVKVVLESEQAVEDLKLLIKLCYSGSYTKDGEELLDRGTRVRLAFLGNAFEIEDCVSECLGSLADDLMPANAFTLLDHVPEELRGHEVMADVTKKVVEFLADLVDKWTEPDPPTAGQEIGKQDIVNALAKALGPVNQFFGEESSWLEHRDISFYTCLPLKPHVLALSPTVIEALFWSDALCVTTENEVYTFLGCWLHQSPHGGARRIALVTPKKCLPLFRRLVKLVRFQHLSLDYIGNVVTACPLATESSLLSFMLRSSLGTREANPDVWEKERGAGLVQRNRGRGNQERAITSTLFLTDLLTLAEGGFLRKRVALIDGCPIQLKTHRRIVEEDTKFALYVSVIMPPWEEQEWEGGLERCASFEFQVQVGTETIPRTPCLFDSCRSKGNFFFYRKLWQEFIQEGSACFPDSQLSVKVGMRPAVDRRREKGVN